jgi:hypothetical protein
VTSRIIPIVDLPADPLAAAAEFHARELPRIRHNLIAQTTSDVVLVFRPAGHEHQAWRLAAVQGLARELAPIRVNGVAGEDESAVTDAGLFLNDAPGITGQLLSLHNG